MLSCATRARRERAQSGAHEEDRLHGHLHVAGRSMQRRKHQGRSDQKTDCDGENEGVIGSDGVFSS
jgi:hypothetical protein